MGPVCYLCGYEVFKDAKGDCAPRKEVIDSRVVWVHAWCLKMMGTRSSAEAQRVIQSHAFKGTTPPGLVR